MTSLCDDPARLAEDLLESPLAERSVGTSDAGAVSMALCLRAVGQVLTEP